MSMCRREGHFGYSSANKITIYSKKSFEFTKKNNDVTVQYNKYNRKVYTGEQ